MVLRKLLNSLDKKSLFTFEKNKAKNKIKITTFSSF